MRKFLLAAAIAAVPVSVLAEEPVETVYVWGKRMPGVGIARSASEGVVDFSAFEDRPLLRAGEIAEVVPGLAVTQHSGTGKANQYFLRGFNLDHGTDFSVSLDGVPLNLRTNAHGQGYLDLNILIPELIETVSYRKGPYYSESGDFSAAGTAAISTFREPHQTFASVTIGQNNYYRLLGVTAIGGDAYAALDLTSSEGPWIRPENLKKAVGHLHAELGSWSFTLAGYGASWDATDQIPLRAVEAGLLDRLGTINPTDGGDSMRLIASARLERSNGLEAQIFVQKYQLNLWSDFTYFLDNPVDGDQFQQSEKRWIFGGHVRKSWDLKGPWAFRSGAEFRYDDIGEIGLYRTAGRNILSTDRQDSIAQGSFGAWADATWTSGPFRAVLGARVDAMHVDVTSDTPANSGTAGAAFVSPKATLAWQVSDTVEFYLGGGRSFHSNDARGATTRVMPGTLAPLVPVPVYAGGWGGELGMRYEKDGLTATLAGWWLKLESELVYVGDAGDTSSSDGTTRTGLEFLLNYTPKPGLNFDFSAATTHARYDDVAPGLDRIPGALEYVLTGGVSAVILPDWTAEMTVRHLGQAPLVEDNAVRSETSTVVNLLTRYNLGRVSLTLEFLNLFDAEDSDITYFYESQLAGEPAPVEDIHFHPMEPRTLRGTIRLML